MKISTAALMLVQMALDSRGKTNHGWKRRCFYVQFSTRAVRPMGRARHARLGGNVNLKHEYTVNQWEKIDTDKRSKYQRFYSNRTKQCANFLQNCIWQMAWLTVGGLCKTIKNVIEPILFVFKAVNDFANFNVDDPESVSVCASVYIMSVSRKGFLGIYWSHHQQTCQSDCLRHDNASRVNYLDLGLYSRSHRS